MYVFNSEKPISWSSNFTDKLLHPIVLKNTGVKVVQVLVLLYCNEKLKFPLSLVTFAVSLFINKEMVIGNLHKIAMPVLLISQMDVFEYRGSPLEVWDKLVNPLR